MQRQWQRRLNLTQLATETQVEVYVLAGSKAMCLRCGAAGSLLLPCLFMVFFSLGFCFLNNAVEKGLGCGLKQVYSDASTGLE